MTTLNTKDFNTLVSNAAANVQGSSSQLLDLSVGSILLSVIEAMSSVAIWLQGMIIQLLTVTRAATCSSGDLDTWCADYNFYRLPATNATGVVTFARFTPSAQATIPVGSLVQTADGTQQYSVVANNANPLFNTSLNAYVLPIGTASGQINVQAVTAGTGANAIAGAINSLGQAIPFIDTVTNVAAFTNGMAAESDSAMRIRFVAYISSLSKATRGAIQYAVTSVQSGLSDVLTENYNYAGQAQPGYFYVCVDDGTGYPSQTLISNIYNAIDAVRGFTVAFGVFPPIVVTASVNMTIVTSSGYNHSVLSGQVQAAITNAINSLGLGNSLSITKLAQIAYGVSPGITNVTGVTINGGNTDLAATQQQSIHAGTVTVN